MSSNSMPSKPSKEEATKAIKTLLAYIGENPERNELLGTPKRILNAYDELFSGYQENPALELNREFEEIKNYSGMILVRDIRFISHCEHHMMMMQGKAHVAYLPNQKIAGLSKLSRVVGIFSKRLQSQERFCAEVADALEEHLKPKGVAVIVDATHACMSIRGIKDNSSSTYTSEFRGAFLKDESLKQECLLRLQ